MDLVKSYDFFKPELCNARVHILGCGSVGSTIAENLARCGITKMTLWDFDTVEAKNVHNQMFRNADIGKKKVEALRDIILEINPDAKDDIELKPDGWQGNLLSGYIFLAVDNIDIRRDFVEKHYQTPFVKAVFDIRTELTGAQHYAADWMNFDMKKNLLNTMQFTHEEATSSAPVSACGVTLGVVTTVRIICALAVNNFIRFLKGEGIWKYLIADGFAPGIEAF